MVLSFLSDRSVTKTILGEERKFYPMSLRAVMRMRQLGNTVAKALAVFFSAPSNRDTTIEEMGSGDGYKKSSIFKPGNPQLAQQILRDRQNAIDDLTMTLLDEGQCELLAALIEDALRVPKADRCKSREEAFQFAENLSADALAEIIMAMMEANKVVFDPLGKLGQEALARLKEKTTDAVASEDETKSPKTTGS